MKVDGEGKTKNNEVKLVDDEREETKPMTELAQQSRIVDLLASQDTMMNVKPTEIG